MQDIIHDTQDMTWLEWGWNRQTPGSVGTFMKAYSIGEDGKKIYFKLSNFDVNKGVIGHECINELIAARLLSILGIEHLDYQLINADIKVSGRIYNTWLCASRDFKRDGEEKISLDDFYKLNAYSNDTPLDFCIRKGWGKYIYNMLVFDFLILNRDRHGANIEILRNTKTNTERPAPLFDNGLSLLFSCHTLEVLNNFNVLADRPIQSFLGGRSVLENLSLIPVDQLPQLVALKDTDKDILLAGLDDALDHKWLGKIWEMILGRWKIYEDICAKKQQQRKYNNLDDIFSER